MNDLLIAKIARRASDPRTRIEMAIGPPSEIAAPISTAEVAESERALGFPIPVLLKQLYEKVGNGGFGPGYGLIGLIGGKKDDQGQDAVGSYASYSGPDHGDPDWRWPDGLLPICH